MIQSVSKKKTFEAVYEESYEKLYKYAYMLLLNREDAEDIVSESFMAAFSHYAEYDPDKGSILAWISRIAHNKAINLMNSSYYKSRNPIPKEDIQGTGDHLLSGMTATNETAELILSHLDLQEREFLNLRYGLELSDKEIGKMLDMKENTVSKRYQRLLRKCRDIADNN